jgi:hypothetical protein
MRIWHYETGIMRIWHYANLALCESGIMRIWHKESERRIRIPSLRQFAHRLLLGSKMVYCSEGGLNPERREGLQNKIPSDYKRKHRL